MPPLTDKAASFARTETEEGTVGQWMPIESAPRTDEEILVCDARTHGGFCQVVSWNFDPQRIGWHWETSDGPTFHQDAFTHWMKLPAPPSDAALGNPPVAR